MRVRDTIDGGKEDEQMDLQIADEINRMRIDKRVLQQAIAELNARMGLKIIENVTPEQCQQILLKAGIRPEDNVASCELKQMRYESSEN